MNIIIDESKPPVGFAQIDEVEQRLGIKLPADYRDFLLANNGGRPTPNGFHFKVGDAQESGEVNFFLGVHDGEFSNFERTFRRYKVTAVRIPAELVPIASDSFGNLVCLALSGEKTGAVYFWDHENEGPRGRPHRKNVHLIADSFTEFLNLLH